jgi:trehalose 6-phosphate phosphatase
MMDAMQPAVIPLERIDAVVFDMDGVITDTATAHGAAWKRMFDDYLEERARLTGERAQPFDDEVDYRRFIDGKARYDGVRSFLASRGISLPQGEPDDPPDRETVCGLGNRKNDYFVGYLRDHGASAYPATVALLRQLRIREVGTAVISASQNAAEVMSAAGVLDLLDVRVDGAIANELALPGKPDPAMFLEATRRLGSAPERTAVIEDAIAGVEAGRLGGFGLVVGVDRIGHPDWLRSAGADIVVTDLAQLELVEARPRTPSRDPRVRDLPLALDRASEIHDLLAARGPAIFLDYDGTLTPIVERPEDARLPPETRDELARLSLVCPVAIVSGRDLGDVRALVGLGSLTYAGSHGFDVLRADGSSDQRAREYLPDVNAAEGDLRPLIARIPGVRLERKAFGVAVHYRQVEDDRVADVDAAVAAVAAAHPRLRRTGGKKVFELRPDVDWDKGKAVLWLLQVLGADHPGVLPIYVGDDETDEDAFRAIRERGLGVVVRGEADDRPTAARYALRGTEDARDFLRLLTGIVEQRLG